MTSRSIRWTRRALRHLDSIHRYIAKDKPKAALHVVQTLVAAINRLAEFPTSAREGRVKGTRELVVSGLPFIIAYRFSNKSLDILAILHTSRKWPEQI